MTKRFKNVAVIGAGQMGAGIAQVLASKGFKVFLCDSSTKQLEKAQTSIHLSAEKLFLKKKLEIQEKDQAKTLINYLSELQSLPEVDLVIEAIIENCEAKKELWKELDSLQGKDCVFASNTSSISITELASVTNRAEKFIGMHFMNPVPLMKLVELIPGLQTSKETKTAIKELALFLGKEVTSSEDSPGFVVNRILMPMINEAFTAWQEGVASPKDIDKAMCLGTNQAMGPLLLADFIGLDTCLAILELMYKEIGDPRYRPSLKLKQHVKAGFFGKKTGRGVYSY